MLSPPSRSSQLNCVCASARSSGKRLVRNQAAHCFAGGDANPVATSPGTPDAVPGPPYVPTSVSPAASFPSVALYQQLLVKNPQVYANLMPRNTIGGACSQQEEFAALFTAPRPYNVIAPTQHDVSGAVNQVVASAGGAPLDAGRQAAIAGVREIYAGGQVHIAPVPVPLVDEDMPLVVPEEEVDFAYEDAAELDAASIPLTM